jgi:hypothetical protein
MLSNQDVYPGENAEQTKPETTIIPELPLSTPDIGGCVVTSQRDVEVQSKIQTQEQEEVLPTNEKQEIANDAPTDNKAAVEKESDNPNNTTEIKNVEQEKPKRRGRPPKAEKQERVSKTDNQGRQKASGGIGGGSSSTQSTLQNKVAQDLPVVPRETPRPNGTNQIVSVKNL